MQPAPQQQFAEPMPSALPILAGIVPRACQVSNRPSSGVGGCTVVSKPARPNSTSFRASRRFVFTRSPGFRGIRAGAMTSHCTRGVVICRCSA
jgi:hypothetical protein